MVKKKMYQRIQKLKRRGKSKTEIATELKIDPATVQKYYGMDLIVYRKYLIQVLERKKSFDGYEQEIKEIYELNDSKNLNMAAVYDYLEERYDDLPGNEQTLRNYIHYLIQSGKLILSNGKRYYEKVAPLAYGKQLQIDFGEYKTRSKIKLYIFVAVLSASRYKYVAFQGDPFKTIDVIHHLLDCFDYLGGMPQELVIDQDTLMVISENHGNIVFTDTFRTFIEEMKLKMYVCRKADPESKGKIENVIKYVKYNFLQVRDFDSIEEANESVGRWLKRRGNGKISQATKKIPANEIDEERKYLRAVQNSVFRKDSLLGREERQVTEKSLITVGANEYSVPIVYRNRTVEIYKTERELYVYDGKTGKEITKHQLSALTGKRIKKDSHFRNKSLCLQDLHQQILEMHSFAAWKEFVEINLKSFQRHTRDQCIYAKKHFQEVEEGSILEMAVQYCLENKTVSMTELQDTYQYMLQEHKQDQATIQNAFMRLIGNPRPESPKVSKRSVAEYETLAGSPRGGAK